ncbi:MAG: N-acetylneuraminate lyase [Treponema sp.]|uniref:N-acetylneuraminate lyase n=1 Tax=Treponema sp. TaxID=166 RepID=UPI003FA1CED3
MVKKEFLRSGLYSALITPYNKSGELDTAMLCKVIKHQLDKGVEGFYCCGSSGEGLLLSNDERKKILEVVLSEVSGQVPVVAHVGALSTRNAVDLARHAEKTGACAVSAIPPIYYHYSQNEINRYYIDILQAIDVDLIVYNIPQFTGISFTAENPLLKNRRISGIKHTSMNLYDLERIGKAYPEKTLINGFDEIYASALAAGATATIGTMANICPKLHLKIRGAFLAGKNEEAYALQHRLNDVIQVFVNSSVFPATKYALFLQGFDVGQCRKPFAPLTQKQKQKINSAMNAIADVL